MYLLYCRTIYGADVFFSRILKYPDLAVCAEKKPSHLLNRVVYMHFSKKAGAMEQQLQATEQQAQEKKKGTKTAAANQTSFFPKESF